MKRDEKRREGKKRGEGETEAEKERVGKMGEKRRGIRGQRGRWEKGGEIG